MGTIITFFSYKGGVGRTMALANIAVLLSKRGKKVLVVDWDLEAPGLDRYFDDYDVIESKARMGLLGLLKQAATLKKQYRKKPDWRKYVSKVHLSGTETLDVIWSGSKKNNDYERDVLKFDWDKFFEEQGGGKFVESLRDEWKQEYDFVFIDSRTGITDSGGICTIQMPDILTLVFTPNFQSLNGAKNVALRAQKARQKLAYDRMPLLIFPLPSRFDSRVEYEESKRWLEIFTKELSEFYDDWLPEEYSRMEVLEKTKLPHVPYFSFGEKLAVESSSLSDPESLGYAYNTTTSLYQNNFKNVANVLKISITAEKKGYGKSIKWYIMVLTAFTASLITAILISFVSKRFEYSKWGPFIWSSYTIILGVLVGIFAASFILVKRNLREIIRRIIKILSRL